MINVNGYTDNILMYFCKPPEPVSHRNYDVCIYIYMTFLADAIEKDNLTSIKQLIEDLGGWPVLNKDWKEENFNLTDLLIKITLYTANPLIFMFVYRDFKNPTNHMLYVSKRKSLVIYFKVFSFSFFSSFILIIKQSTQQFTKVVSLSRVNLNVKKRKFIILKQPKIWTSCIEIFNFYVFLLYKYIVCRLPRPGENEF